MKIFLYIFLFVTIFCSDPRRPSKSTKQCLIKQLGEEQAKSLFSSFRKYHRSNGKAKFTEFINNKKPELKETLEKCLSQKLRRLDKKTEYREKIKALKEIYANIRIGNEDEALNKCKEIMKDENLCEKIVKSNAKLQRKKYMK